jgi:alkyl hydroperoxide reductase subunit F
MTDATDTGHAEIELADLLQRHLPAPVRLMLFTSSSAPTSALQRELLEGISQLSSRLSLEIHDLDTNGDIASRNGVDKAPCTVVIGTRGFGMRFYGTTAGHEFSSLLEAILIASNGRSRLSPTLQDWVRRIATPTQIEVFVTITCPNCPRMVHLALQMAMVNENIRADMVETAEFPALARAHDVKAVPHIVVNGRPAFHGLLSDEEAVLEIIRAASPLAFEELEAQLRASAGASRARAPQSDHVYDTIVVGAGPAAMSAALYATRKGLDVFMVGDRLGGQVSDTATVDNWIGAKHIGGHDLALTFRAHVEHYRIAELLHATVASVERRGDLFVARLEDGAEFRGRSVIYCAGKRYRVLGVPGEARFLGRGIAFCATCDAPLFGGKRVVVVGGGNSAFSAARDLVSHAAEIHLVNLASDWQADAILQLEIANHPKIRLHPATKVVEFLGDSDLTGVRLEPVGSGASEVLPVDGAFLELGLIPNSGPVASLVPLNSRGEIPANHDQTTTVPGFFAAGDVTDEPEKQIVVAAAAGAKAGLAAHQYLVSLDGRNPAHAP